MAITIVDHGIPYDHSDPCKHNLYDITFYGLSVRTLLTPSPLMVSSWLSSRGSQPLLIGLAVQWQPNLSQNENNPIAVLQLSVGLHCLIFKLLNAPEIPQALADFLRDPRHVFVGVGIDEKVQKLLRDHCLGVSNAVDLRALAARELGREDSRSAGLRELTRDLLGREMERPLYVSASGWDSLLLSIDQVQYACLETFVSLRIGEALSAGGGARP